MTARILAFPTPTSREDDVESALKRLRAMAVTSVVPAQLVAALMAPEASTVDVTIRRVPVVVTVGAGQMTPDEVVDAWRRLLHTPFPPGASVLVGCPHRHLEEGGAA